MKRTTLRWRVPPMLSEPRHAGQIVICYELYGPDQPLRFADSASWKCSAR